MRKIKHIGFILLAFYCLFFTGCKKDENPRETTIEGTLDKVIASRKSAIVSGRFSGTITGIQQFGFLYSTSDVLEPNAQSTLIFTVDGSFQVGKTYTATLTGLESGKKYYYCMYVSNGTHVMKTQASEFTTTQKSKAVLGEMRLDEAGEYSLSFSCSILDDGGSNITQCGFSYKVHSVAAGEYKSKLVSPESFKAVIDELSPGEFYDVYPFAINDDGMATGDTIQFTTQGFEAPIVKTDDIATGMYGSDWIQLNGSVENDGKSKVVSAGFYYTTEDKDPTAADKEILVTDMKKLKYKLTGLKQGTTYSVRAFAKNSTKIGYGKTIKIKTLEEVLPVCEQPEIKETTDTSVKLEAVVSLGSNEVEKMGFCYSKDGNPKIETGGTVVEVEDIVGNSLKATITGLMPDREYIVCSFIKSKTKDPIYSKPQKMKTSADPAPTIGKLSFSDIQKTSVYVQAEVYSSVGITKQVFLYSSTNHTPRLGGNDVKEQSFSGSATINNLTPNTLYYVCAYVLNEAGKEVYSLVETVTTVKMELPVLSNVTIKKEGKIVRVGAIVSSESEVNECGVCFSTINQTPTIADTTTKMLNSSYDIRGDVTNLQPNTTYYMRVYATSVAGTGYSDVVKISIGSNIPDINDNESPDKN